jgi:hypothetical protein
MRIYLVVFLLVVCECNIESTDHTESNGLSDKVTFDTSRLDDEGLQGNADAKRSLSYEFCIPNTPKCKDEVKAIDPGAQFSRSRGRIGCNKEQLLCIGSSHQTGFKEILEKLCGLEYIKRIDECFFE